MSNRSLDELRFGLVPPSGVGEDRTAVLARESLPPTPVADRPRRKTLIPTLALTVGLLAVVPLGAAGARLLGGPSGPAYPSRGALERQDQHDRKILAQAERTRSVLGTLTAPDGSTAEVTAGFDRASGVCIDALGFGLCDYEHWLEGPLSVSVLDGGERYGPVAFGIVRPEAETIDLTTRRGSTIRSVPTSTFRVEGVWSTPTDRISSSALVFVAFLPPDAGFKGADTRLTVRASAADGAKVGEEPIVWFKTNGKFEACSDDNVPAMSECAG